MYTQVSSWITGLWANNNETRYHEINGQEDLTFKPFQTKTKNTCISAILKLDFTDRWLTGLIVNTLT